jgi:ribosomal protein S12 methylthiotransferase
MMPAKRKKYYLSTLGCAKNEVDSEALEVDLLSAGMIRTDRIESADLVLVNSCGFINDAKAETIETTLSLHNARKKNSLLVMCGCLPARYDMREIFGEVDLFLPSDRHNELIPFLKKMGWTDDFHDCEIKRIKPNLPFGYLKISEGCDNRCAYCAIPDIKGPFVSRPVDQLVAEAEFLCRNSVRELVLIGQDTTLFGTDRGSRDELPNLIERLVSIEGLEWLRIMYAHPAHFTDSMIDMLASTTKIVKYVDLPLQHISDPVLKRMNRKIDRDGIDKLIHKLRDSMPDIALRTTFMVGFPGEADSDFGELLDFCENTGFDSLGIFKYSPEDRTPAVKFPGRLDKVLVEERYLTLLDLQNKISKAKLDERIGQIQQVLIQEVNGESGAAGRTWFQAPEVDGITHFKNCSASPGEMIKARISGADGYDLYAEPFEEE